MATQRVLLGNIRGPKGETGATGPTGPAGTISVGTVTKGEYGTPPQVTNSGTSTAATFDFVIPEGAPGDTVAAIDNLTLDEPTASTATLPIPAAGERGKVIFGKIIKFCNDIKKLASTSANGLLRALSGNTSQWLRGDGSWQTAQNNLTTTAAGYVLDARQGKALNDKVTTLNDSFILYRSYTITYSPQTGVSPNNGCTLRRRGYTGVFIVNLSFNNFTNRDYVQVASAASVKLTNDYVMLVPVTEGGYVFVKVAGNGSVQVAKYSASSQCSGQVLVSIPVIFDVTTDD